MSNLRKTVVTNCEKSFLIKNLAEYTRLDGRAFDEFRDVKIEFGKDFGCCYVSLGRTKVLAQVSSEIQQPKQSRSSEGILNLNVELNPIAAPNFEAGRQSDLSVQLNRLLEKCLKDSKAVDLESLCIKMNEKVWAIRVDINVLNHEGNILDCASIAALTALAHFRRPDVTCEGEEFTIHNYKQRDPIPLVIHHYPVCVTYSLFQGGDYIVADPNLLEEGVADAFLSIGLNSYKELCGLHLGGKVTLNPDIILQTTNKAASRATIITQQIKDAVENDNQRRLERRDYSFDSLFDKDLTEASLNLSIRLDEWSINKKSKKKQHKEAETMEEVVEENISKDDTFIANIESLGTGTAALVPTDSNSKEKVWLSSDTDEDEPDCDVIVIEEPKPIVHIFDSDSEEEAVMVLNADEKTNKKKKKRIVK